MLETGRHRRHRNLAEADRLAAEYEASGISQAEFSRQRDLPLKTLARYVARFRKHRASGNEPHSPQRFVAVEVAGRNSAAGDELTVLIPGGLRIEVKRGFDAGTLRQLIAVLEAR